MGKNYQKMEFWTKDWPSMDNPLGKRRITENSVFLHTLISYHSASAGRWEVFPGLPELAAFLKYKFLLFCFGEWLVREEWDEAPKKPMASENLFDEAIASGRCRYTDDIPSMRRTVSGLDEIIAGDNPASGRDAIRKIQRSFNRKWQHTGNWSFSFRVFDDPVRVGRDVFRRFAEEWVDPEDEFADRFGLTKQAWYDVCRQVTSTKKVEASFREVLEEAEIT